MRSAHAGTLAPRPSAGKGCWGVNRRWQSCVGQYIDVGSGGVLVCTGGVSCSVAEMVVLRCIPVAEVVFGCVP